MAMALEIHREMDANARVTPVEREMRRRLFWTCYLLDRLLACGSKRASLFADKAILLRLPSWSHNHASPPVEGEFFRACSNLQYLQGSGKNSQGGTGMLIDIVRILGITNMYLAAGGVKGDPCFPWHTGSQLSKIRQELDTWASGTDDILSSPDALFGQSDSTVLVLSKLIYHVIHCLIYRPFLPVDLSELTGTSQHQSWQIEATNMCFFHANAIAELVDMGKQAPSIEWPAFVGYAICTAGTVHIHGAHYNKAGGALADMTVFSQSAEFLSREMQHLSELRYAWASVQHQRETLQSLYNIHAELVKTVGFSSGFSSSFQLEDFFDRYSNISASSGQPFILDIANLSLSDVVVDFAADACPSHGLYAPRATGESETLRPILKRKNTMPSERARLHLALPTVPMVGGPHSAGLPTTLHRPSFSGMPPPPSPMIATPNSLPDEHMAMDMNEEVANNAAVAAAAAAGFSMPPPPHAPTVGISATPFSSQYTFSAPHGSGNHHDAQVNMGANAGGYDPMFSGMATNAYASPASMWQRREDKANTEQRSNEGVSSPGAKSNPSTSTGVAEEKDPFLSMLEQLAESEGRRPSGGRPGSEFDFFFPGNAGTN